MNDDRQASTGEDKGSADEGAPAKDRNPGEMSLEELAKVAGGGTAPVALTDNVTHTVAFTFPKSQTSTAPIR